VYQINDIVGGIGATPSPIGGFNDHDKLVLMFTFSGLQHVEGYSFILSESYRVCPSGKSARIIDAVDNV
jgi:hypothetical protein